MIIFKITFHRRNHRHLFRKREEKGHLRKVINFNRHLIAHHRKPIASEHSGHCCRYAHRSDRSRLVIKERKINWDECLIICENQCDNTAIDIIIFCLRVKWRKIVIVRFYFPISVRFSAKIVCGKFLLRIENRREICILIKVTSSKLAFCEVLLDWNLLKSNGYWLFKFVRLCSDDGMKVV